MLVKCDEDDRSVVPGASLDGLLHQLARRTVQVMMHR